MKATIAPPVPVNVILELTAYEAELLLRVAQLNVTIPNAMRPQYMYGRQAVEDFLEDLASALRTATKEPKQ